jgi:hypothetical protein
MFLAYLRVKDFPGAGMARKFLQMGWTRARRYANHPGGRTYHRQTRALLPREKDIEKADAAAEIDGHLLRGSLQVPSERKCSINSCKWPSSAPPCNEPSIRLGVRTVLLPEGAFVFRRPLFRRNK